MGRKRRLINIITSFLVTFLIFECTFFNESHDSANNQKTVEPIRKLKEHDNHAEVEEEKYKPYFGGLERGKLSNLIEPDVSCYKLPLSQICNDCNEIDISIVESLDTVSFYSNYDSYVTLESKSIIDFSSYSRFEIADWLYSIGKISMIQKLDYYSSFFANAFFENERCLTYVYNNYKQETSNCFSNDINRIYSFQPRTNMQVYSTLHFDINYDLDDFTTDSIPSQIGEKFELIRKFFVDKDYPVPNNQFGYTRYQIYIYHNTNNNGDAGLTVFDGQPYPNTTSYINMYYVSNTTLDSKFDEVAAHEWYHALRTQYYSGLAWFDESFANWAGIIYDGDSEFSNESIINFINADVRLDDESYIYGACLFPLVLYKKYGEHAFIKSLLATYNSIIQNYPSYSDTQKLIVAINQTLISNGYTDTFDDALRSMHSYNYLPNSWYNDVCSTSTTCYWYNSDKTTYNLLELNGGAEYDIEGTQTYSNINVNKLGRKYFQLIPMNGKAYNVEFEVTFNGGNGFAQHHESEPTGAILIGPLNNVNNATSWHFYGLGSRYNNAGIILTNTSPVSNCTCTITIHYKTIRENYTFKLSDRLFERRFFLDKNEYAEYTIQFINPGRKIIQTVGPSDTVIELLSTNNSTLNNPSQDDDKGYSYNSFSVYDSSANETIKIRVRFYSPNSTGFIKLIITNSIGVTDNHYGIQQFTDIVEIVHNNFYYGTWCNQYKSKLLLYHPLTSGTVRISLSSIFDNYLYVIDPTSNTLNQYGVDYDDDSGSGTNASITRYMSSSHSYLIIYVQYNPSSNFTNLDDGDDITVHFERISS